MSSVVISGDTSGSITLAAPAVAGTNTITLPAATGTMLTTASAGTTGTSMVLIGSATASSSATIDFTSISNSSYSAYKIIGYNIYPVTNGANLYLRVSVGGTFQSGASDYRDIQQRFLPAGAAYSGGTASAIRVNSSGDTLANSANSGTQGGCVFDMTFYNAAQTNTVKRATWNASYYGSDYLDVLGSGTYLTAGNAVDGFRFLMDTGNISTGTFFLYGIKNA
jgi:hypothetical protein